MTNVHNLQYCINSRRRKWKHSVHFPYGCIITKKSGNFCHLNTETILNYIVTSRQNILTARSTRDQSELYLSIQNITIPWREIGEEPSGGNIMHKKDLGLIPNRSGDAWEGIRACQGRTCHRLVHHCRPKIRLHHGQTRCWNRSEWGPILCYQTQAPVRPCNSTPAFADQEAAVEEKASRRTKVDQI